MDAGRSGSFRPERSMGALGASVVLLALSLTSPIELPRGIRADQIQVSMVAVGSSRVPQGGPFTFRATATNPGSTQLTVDVLFSLAPTLQPAQSIAFFRWPVSLGAGEQTDLVWSTVPAQWFAKSGDYRVSASIDHLPAGDPLTLRVSRAPIVVPRFEDVTAQAGLDIPTQATSCGEFAAGAAWGDVDGDGDPDLFVPGRLGVSQLWMNDGTGHFVDEAVARGATDPGGKGPGAAFADIDNDGDEDLYVVNDGANVLYLNDGTGHFTDVTALARVGDDGVGPGASWGDYDDDGFVDLYVTNHAPCGYGTQYGADRLYHNEGAGTFTDQTALLGVDATRGAGFQATWFDVDQDGDLDLYLANDRYGVESDRNHLWRNDGPGEGGTWTFTDVSMQSGTNYWINSMGVGVSDIDGDLDLDFALSNIGNTILARNNGDGTFTDVAAKAGVARPTQRADEPSVTWGLQFVDLNLDGWEDLVVPAGALDDVEPQPNEVFANAGYGRFLDLSAPSRADDPGSSRGMAIADYDGDGLPDLFVVDYAGHSRLLRNVTPVGGAHWLGVRLVGSASNRDGCGAMVLAQVGPRQLLRELFCGSIGVASGNQPVVFLGLAGTSTMASLTITWPSGTVQTATNVSADQLVTLVEP
jgi:enediyne biosynthesis protein E4